MKRLLKTIVDNTIIGIAAIFVMWPLLLTIVVIGTTMIYVAKLFGI